MLAPYFLMGVVLQVFFPRNTRLSMGVLTLSFTFSTLLLVLGGFLGHAISDPWSAFNASNVCFDFLTLVLSGWILKKLRKTQSSWGITGWVLLDLLMAAGFAVLSLWWGMIPGDPKTQSLTDWVASLAHTTGFGYSPLRIITVLWTWDDPYFWLMHSTFLPTLACMTALTLLFVRQRTAETAEKYLIRAGEVDDPEKRFCRLRDIARLNFRRLSILLSVLLGLEFFLLFGHAALCNLKLLPILKDWEPFLDKFIQCSPH